MKTIRSYYRPVDPAIVQAFWNMGLDTHEIALRTGFRESDVDRKVSEMLNRRWMERISDQNHLGSSTQC